MYFNNYYFSGPGPFDFSDMELSELLRQNNRIQKRMNELEIMYESIENLDDLAGLSQEIGELKQLSEDIKDEIAGMYTQQEIDHELAKFYTKEEVDILFNALPDFDIDTYYTRAEVDSLISTITPPEVDLTAYYTKSEVDGKIAGLDFDVDLEPYVTDAELQAALESIDNNVDLGNYYTKAETYSQIEVDGMIENITPGESVDLTNYYNKQEVDSLIDSVETGGGGGTGGGVSLDTIRRMHPDANIVHGKMPEDIAKWTNMDESSNGAVMYNEAPADYNIKTYDGLAGEGVLRMSIDTRPLELAAQTIAQDGGGAIDTATIAKIVKGLQFEADFSEYGDGLWGEFSFSETAEENVSFYTIEFPLEGWFDNPGNGTEVPLSITLSFNEDNTDLPVIIGGVPSTVFLNLFRSSMELGIDWIEFRMPGSFNGYSPPIA